MRKPPILAAPLLPVLAAVVAVAVAVPAAGGGTGAVKSVWLPPVELTPRSDNSIWDQDVALDANGDALAVWSGPGGVGARFRPAGGDWQAPVQLATCGASARVAFDASAKATVVWLQCDATGGGSRVTTAFRRLHTGWSAPLALSTPGREAGYLRLAVASSGATVASWGESDDRVWVVEASTREPVSDEWAPAVQLSSVGADAYESSPAVDETGDTIVGWTRGDPAGAIVWAAFKPSGRAWQPAVNLSPPGSVGVDITVAIRPGGDAVAVWDENGQGRSAVRRVATGAWSQPTPFPAYSVQDLVANGTGDVLAVWEQDGIAASELPVGSDTWQRPFKVSSQQSSPLSYAVRFDKVGGLVAVWGMQGGLTTGSVAAARRPAGATDWQAPVTLLITGTIYNANYAVDGAGDAIAVYETPAGTSVGAAILDSAAPQLRSLSFRQSGRVGQRLSFSALPFDISPVTLQWRFGDGRTATGASVTHIYRKAGRYRVTVIATDAAGHMTTAARTTVRVAFLNRSRAEAAKTEQRVQLDRVRSDAVKCFKALIRAGNDSFLRRNRSFETLWGAKTRVAPAKRRLLAI